MLCQGDNITVRTHLWSRHDRDAPRFGAADERDLGVRPAIADRDAERAAPRSRHLAAPRVQGYFAAALHRPLPWLPHKSSASLAGATSHPVTRGVWRDRHARAAGRD